MGITKRARPLERLKKRYADFLSRHSMPPPTAHPPKPAAAAATAASLSASAVSSTASTSAPAPAQDAPPSLHGHNRYAPLLVPGAPGKRPERLMCTLSLIWDPATQSEWCLEEARARSQGLLGKAWPPLVDATVRVHFADSGSSSHTRGGGGGGGATRTGPRKSLAAEPTVTINTKEALADVFGMYNSPEKSVRLGLAAGSKHAPLKRVSGARLARSAADIHDGCPDRTADAGWAGAAAARKKP
jgi:checkpoint serine/threonine-protein kinase